MKTRFDLIGHSYIVLTIAFTVLGQLVLKWQMNLAGPMPDSPHDKIFFLLRQLLNPWIISGFASAFLASMAWMAAMTRFDLSYAYPFMSLAFVVVTLGSVLFFNEPVSLGRVAGTALVLLGLVVITR